MLIHVTYIRHLLEGSEERLQQIHILKVQIKAGDYNVNLHFATILHLLIFSRSLHIPKTCICETFVESGNILVFETQNYVEECVLH